MQEMYLFYDPFLYPLNKIYKFIICTLVVMDILLSFLTFSILSSQVAMK